MRLTILLIFSISAIIQTYCQNLSEKYYQGFEKATGGFNFQYHSAVPDVSNSLLIRADKNYEPISWESEPIPDQINTEFVNFVWIYAIDVNTDSRRFDLYVNDVLFTSFSNPVSNDNLNHVYKSKSGGQLSLNCTMLDKYKDQMGFAEIRIPVSLIEKGNPVRFKISAEKAESNSWYMTFKGKLREEISIKQENSVLKKEGKKFFSADINITYLGSKTKFSIVCNNDTTKGELFPGYNQYQILLPEKQEPSVYEAEIIIPGRKTIFQKFNIKPVKPWYVYMIQHSHTDIGYTRPQTEILPEHLRYIDYALDYCDATDYYPENAKFRWTCETSWAVREYFRNRPKEQTDRLVQRIKEGRIEVTGMLFNYSDIIDEASLATQTRILKNIKDKGIEIKSAMQNDVNGIGWCMTDYFQNTGIKYLIMGEHGHRARIPFDKPTAFWWESPSGKRILAYRSEHYMHGNVLGLISGDIQTFKNNLSDYLNELEEKKYPFEEIAFQFSGYITDNSPPSTAACDLVKEWNDNYEWPKIKLSTPGEFMEIIEKNHSDKLKSIKAAWPDWWTDGVASAANEAKAIRTVQADMICITGLLAMAKVNGLELPSDIYGQIEDVNDNILFYDEHTYGSAESISDPLCENTITQWGEKSAYAWDAVKESKLLKETALGFLQTLIKKTHVPSLVIFNVLGTPRTEMIKVYIDHEIVPENKKFELIDNVGNTIIAQHIESREDGTYWGILAENIPAFGYRSYRIIVYNEDRKHEMDLEKTNTIENSFYRISLEKNSGKIKSIFDKDLNKELVSFNDTLYTGMFVYETLDNRHQMERFTSRKTDTVYVPLKGKRETWQDVTVTSTKAGPLWTSIFVNGKINQCADEKGINLEIRLYNNIKKIDFIYEMVKKSVVSPEAVYIAFPFELEDGKFYYEAQGGIVRPGYDQIEGTSSDWHGVQNFVALRNKEAQIVYSSNDIPLVQFGEINTGKFRYRYFPETTHLFSWVLNNYWTTNFKAEQEGYFSWKYSITSSTNRTNSFATNFGMNCRVPFATRILPGISSKVEVLEKSWMEINPNNIELIQVLPSMDGKGIILHLRESNGQESNFDLKDLKNHLCADSIFKVNILEEKLYENSDQIRLMPYEVVFLKVIFNN